MNRPVVAAACQSACGWTDGVVGERRRDRDPEEGADAEEQADRELLGAADRDVEADDAGDRADEGDDPPATGDVATEVGAEGCDDDR